MLQVQQESINDLKKMITLLLERRKKPKSLKPCGSFSKHSKGKNEEGESSTSEKTDGENNFNCEISKSSSEEEENSEKKVNNHN